MPTGSTDLTKDDIEIRTHKVCPCGQAHIIDTAFLKISEHIEFAGKVKRFLIFVCCEEQKKDAENNIDEVLKICNEMLSMKVEAFVADSHRIIH